jgi:putative glutamine transport system substrate-binding protein
MNRLCKWTAWLLVCLMLVAMAGCSKLQSNAARVGDTRGITGPTIQKIQNRGLLFVGAKHDVPKFGFQDEKTEQVDGFEIDLIRHIAKAILGDETRFETVHVTPKTRMELLNQGAVDLVVATFTITEERKKQVDFSRPYYTDGLALLGPNNGPIKGLADLQGKKVGALRGATAGTRLAELAKSKGITIEIVEFDTYPGAKAALQARQVEAVVGDGAILAGYTDKDYALLPERYSQEPYGIATRKGADDLRQLVDKLLEEMEQSGELRKLQEKWGIAVR